jgi:sugar lactone lactonase YvrE
VTEVAAAVVTDEEAQRRRRRKAILLLIMLGLLLILLLVFGWYLIFRKPINPIPFIPNPFSGPAYQTSIYGPNTPVGVAVSPDGSRIYVAETEGNRAFLVYDRDGRPIAAVRPPAETTGPEHVPVWIAIDPLSADVYVSDRPAGAIYVYDRDGNYQRAFTLIEPIRGWQPMGLAFDANGSLYVADVGGVGPEIQQFDRVGTLIRRFGKDDGVGFLNGLAVDANGRVYVADSNNGRLLTYDSSGTIVARVGRGVGEGELAIPRGVAIDDEGRVHVGDPTAQGIHVFDEPNLQTGRMDYLGFFGGPGTGDGRFAFPNGVALDAQGRVYVADTFNGRIQIWSY